MGYGDDLMAVGLVRALRGELPDAKFVFGDPDTYFDPENNKLNVHWSDDVFRGNPDLVHPDEPVKEIGCIPDYPGQRCYVDYAKTEYEPIENTQKQRILRFKWKPDFHAPRGVLYFSQDEKSAAGEISMRLPYPFFVVEPNTADKPWFNHKSWPFDRWQDFVNAFPDVSFIQFNGDRVLDGVHQVLTPTFRLACGILACSGGFIGTDGGLHHAAAALDLPAVVLWGHYSSPEVFGYTDHVNIRHEDGIGCGSAWIECRECNLSMLKISVDEVVQNFQELLDDGRDKIGRKGADRPIFRMVGETAEGNKK